MTNLIKQIVRGDGYSQNIKMVVKDNERGPKGDQGVPGETATIQAGNVYSIPTDATPAVMNTGSDVNAVFDFYLPKGGKGDQGVPGKDGAIQYTAGAGIKIKNNVISAIGGGSGGGEWGEIIGDIGDQTDLQQEFAKYVKTADLASVATSGSYNDLTDKPTIPAAQVNSDWDAVSGVAQILNKPTIPTVNDATLTIQQNGVDVTTFTANASSNATANITTPAITMTTTDPGEGTALAANNYVGVYGADPIIMDYSTNEVNTGTKWIDGSAIYKKTINFGTLPNSTTKNVAHNISNISDIIKVEAIINQNSGENYKMGPLVYASDDSSYNTECYANSTIVGMDTTQDRSNCTAYVTLYYTKSS